jgi:hypothetical protein
MTGAQDSEEHSLPSDTLYTLFAKVHRREVLAHLERKDTDVADLDELADCVHDEVDEVTSPSQARLTLTHAHLPKLAEHNVIEFDDRSETVRYRDGTRVEDLLEIVATDDQPA